MRGSRARRRCYQLLRARGTGQHAVVPGHPSRRQVRMRTGRTIATAGYTGAATLARTPETVRVDDGSQLTGQP